MYRETESGLRYYVKEGDRRVISQRPTKSITALAFGVTLDPSYAFPLPIFGIELTNFIGRSQRGHALIGVSFVQQSATECGLSPVITIMESSRVRVFLQHIERRRERYCSPQPKRLLT